MRMQTRMGGKERLANKLVNEEYKLKVMEGRCESSSIPRSARPLAAYAEKEEILLSSSFSLSSPLMS